MKSGEGDGGGASLTTEPAAGTSAATDVSLIEHLRALRSADHMFAVERDRRYTEVAAEREKALKIKESADLAALELAREIQTYKDEQHNGLLGQLRDERAEYVTRAEWGAMVSKLEASITPLSTFVTSQNGAQHAVERRQGATQPWFIWAAGAFVSVCVALAAIAIGAFT